MELPRNRERFKRDLYQIAAGLAIGAADVAVVAYENPQNDWVRIPMGLPALVALGFSLAAAGRMAKSDYDLKDQQLTIFDEQKIRES